MIYPAKRDFWLTTILVPGYALMILAGLALPVILAAQPAAPVAAFFFQALASFTCIVVGVLFLWVFLSASYEITAAELVIRFGPYRWRMPLDAIVEVYPRRRLFGVSWGFALSLDRLRIKYRKKNGKISLLPVEVSPKDKAGFLAELSQTVPGLQLWGDRAVRVGEGAAAGNGPDAASSALPHD